MKRNMSIRGLTGKYLALVLLVSLMGLVVMAWIGRQSVNEDIARHQRFEIKVLQRQFSELLGFYQDIASQMSRGDEVVEILEFADKERAVVWAQEVRALIPESIGAALIDPGGEILGEPLQLNLGKECVSDIHALFSGEHVSAPPIHRANPRLAHFDVIREVRRDGEIVGLVFLSFSLDTIQRRVNELAGSGQVLAVLDSSNHPVAKFGDVQHYRMEGPHRVAIAGSDWNLFYTHEGSVASDFLIYTLAIAGLLTIVTLGVVVLLSLRLVSLFKSDLGTIKDQLGGVYRGGKEEPPQGQPLLKETSDIMKDVGELMANIKEANARLTMLSVNDELSGLLNRRGFNDKLQQGWELSDRGVTASLVFLDIDYFKQVNDRFGHGAGDGVIVAMAEALRERCRKSDVIARLGGDEFAVILNSIHQPEGIEHWYGELVGHFELLLQDTMPSLDAAACSISAGAVALDKGRHPTLQLQMNAADRALYQAKKEGRARIVCLFDDNP